jgi:hypothetical protein
MAERVIDDLEVVEVEEQQDDLGLGSVRMGHRLSDPVFDQQAIRHLG